VGEIKVTIYERVKLDNDWTRVRVEVPEGHRRDGSARTLLKDSLYLSKLLTMLSHSASSGSRLTGLPARPYQYAALLWSPSLRCRWA
jgi:hypothetical protein